MKKTFLILILLFISTSIFGKIKEPKVIQSYKSTFWIFGKEDCTYQFSIKFGLWFPYESGLFFAYTQKSLWKIYDKSSPFEETNYSPSIFWEKENPFKLIDFLRIIPYEHKSNGRDHAENRSMERGFIEGQLSYGNYFNFGIREKAGWFYAKAVQNRDLKRYIGYFETELFAQIKSKHGFLGHEKLYIKGEWTHKYGWFEAGFSFRIFTTKIRPHIYAQWYYGYGEFLLNYNQKTNAVRIGLIFNEL